MNIMHGLESPDPPVVQVNINVLILAVRYHLGSALIRDLQIFGTLLRHIAIDPVSPNFIVGPAMILV
jgi:hypothetical protein